MPAFLLPDVSEKARSRPISFLGVCIGKLVIAYTHSCPKVGMKPHGYVKGSRVSFVEHVAYLI